MPLTRALGRQIVRRLDRMRTSGQAQAVYADHLTYLNARKMRRLEKAVKTAMAAAPGSVVEFGVALGGSAIVLAKHADGQARRFHGFDVFGMIPPPTSDKDDANAKSRYEVIVAGESAGIHGDLYYGYREDLYGDVCRAFDRHGIPVDGGKVQLHEGLFEDSLKGFPEEPIAFAHLDCDWYDPVELCLEAVHARSAPGTVIVLDDYNDYSGCRLATDEFLAAHPGYRMDPGANAVLTRQR